MKAHKFDEEIPCMGDVLQKCISCEAISIDKDLAPYSDVDNWLVVSNDCDKAGKQIELMKRQREIEESRKFFLCW